MYRVYKLTPELQGWEGDCLCVRTMAVERGRARLSCTTGDGATVIGVKRERKKSVGRVGMTGGERVAKANEPRCARERGLSGPPPFSPSVLLIYTIVFTVYGWWVCGLQWKRGRKGVREGVHYYCATSYYYYYYCCCCSSGTAALSQCNSLVFPPQQPPATWLFVSLHHPLSIFRYCAHNTPPAAGLTALQSRLHRLSHIDISI